MTIDQLNALTVGDDFTVRGRTHSFYGYEGWTWGTRNGREYADVPTFKPGGGKKFTRVYVTA
jgi:hypothetical protein